MNKNELLEELESLIFDIKIDLEHDDTDNATIEMCGKCLNIIEKLKEEG